MRFIELINRDSYSDYINVDTIVAVTVRAKPPCVEVHTTGGTFWQEYTTIVDALTGQDEILQEIHGNE